MSSKSKKFPRPPPPELKERVETGSFSHLAHYKVWIFAPTQIPWRGWSVRKGVQRQPRREPDLSGMFDFAGGDKLEVEMVMVMGFPT